MSMTIKECLNQYVSLKKEQEEVERRIKKLEKALQRLEEEGTVIDSVSGGYGGTQHFVIEGFPLAEFSEVRTALQKQKLRLSELLRDITKSLDVVHELINNMEDSEMRRILTYRYIYGYTWDKSARCMGGRYNGDALKKRVFRFFGKKQKSGTNVPF